MPTLPTSSRHCELILNGHRFVSFSDDDPPVEFSDIDLLDTTFGRDGTLYANELAVQGGEVVVKLQPTSQSAKRCLRWFAEIQKGARMEFEGTYGDNELSYSVALRGGFMMKCPASIMPGKTFEVTFVFEQLIPDFDAARFEPPPVLV